jgi:hypothetical protein
MPEETRKYRILCNNLLAGFIHITENEFNAKVGEIILCEMQENRRDKPIDVLEKNRLTQSYNSDFSDIEIAEALLINADIRRSNFNKVEIELIQK